MPFRAKGNELIQQLRRAKERELAALEQLHAYMQSPDLQHARLRTLTDEMVATSELSARLSRELQGVVPEPPKD